MTFEEILTQVHELLERQGRVSYRALKRRFELDDDYLEDVKAELIDAQRVAADEDGKVLIWTGAAGTAPDSDGDHKRAPLSYTPIHLVEKILNSRQAVEGERKQVTVLFADLKGSMELLADRDPEEARRLLDPVLERLMEAVHRYEGTVNQVMGDGIMALFGAPLAHEDHAVRACYAALRMQESVRRYAEEARRAHGLEVQIRIGLNSGEVVVRAVGSDLRMDYSAVGQTTHLAARMEQLAPPGTVRLTGDTVRLAEGYVEVRSLGPIPVKGLPDPIEIFELTGAGQARTRLQAAALRGLTRFVGRDAELELLRQALGRANEGHGQIVAVVGEPGVGKSRLAWEFTHSHRSQGWLVLETASMWRSCLNGSSTPALRFPPLGSARSARIMSSPNGSRELSKARLRRVTGIWIAPRFTAMRAVSAKCSGAFSTAGSAVQSFGSLPRFGTTNMRRWRNPAASRLRTCDANTSTPIWSTGPFRISIHHVAR
jgi:class 3 adenylate cyclase